MAGNTHRPTQGKPTLSISGANRLDSEASELLDRLEALENLCRDLAEHHPAIPELREILRRVKVAHTALERAKRPARVLWGQSAAAASREGCSNG